MFTADRLSGLNLRLRFRNSARLSRRPCNRRLQLAAEVSHLEQRCLMSRSVLGTQEHVERTKHKLTSPNDVLTPTNTPGIDKLDQVFFDKLPAQAQKTITITNTSDENIYPILEDKNNAAAYRAPGKTFDGSIYDPEDPQNQDYRGYIGYKAADGVNTLGLAPGQTITVNVPLVFWDAARMDITTDPTYITTTLKEGDAITNNPFQYYKFDADGTTQTKRFWAPANGPAGTNGMVMWYHAPIARSPLDDAPSQLAEFTIRDPYQLTLNPGLDPKTLGPLINYDVSYVDSMVLPVAMEATNVPIPNATPAMPAAYGWTGAAQTTQTLQAAIKNFTSDDPNLNGLGQYFGGKGWPSFNIPTTAETKVPSGTNAIADSPFFDKRSSYDTFGPINQYQLTSGGKGAIEVPGGNGGFGKGTDILELVPAEKLNFLADGMVVKLAPGQPDGPTLPPGTTIVPNGIIRTNGQVTAVKLTSTIRNTGDKSFTFTFNTPVMDYATTKMTDLWYSWAQYFVDTHPISAVNNLAGSIAPGSRVLNINAQNLEVGMGVTGTGILPGTTISSISTDETSVNLSQLAQSGGTTYDFTPPSLTSIAGYKEVEDNLIPLTFADGTDTDTAKLFSQAVYQVMSAMSTIPPDKAGPVSAQLMVNMIGCNVGFLNGKDLKHPENNVNTEIMSEVRDEVKSILRGVYDFNEVPQFNPVTGALQWYPDPSVSTGGQNFNVYNLDPFVWFVHQQLHLSGYGFSVDDDTADIGAEGATQLDMTIGGLGAAGAGLPNKAEYTQGAPYGPVTGTGTPVRSSNPPKQPGDSIIGLTDPSGTSHNVFYQVNFTNKANAVQGALVNGPGIQPNTRVANINLSNYQVILDNTLASGFTPDPGMIYTYTFFGPVTGAGDLQQSNNEITGLDPNVVATLAKIGPGPAVTVTGPGVPAGTTLQSIDPANNLVVLNPSSPLTQPTGPGPYYYTFA